MPAIGAIVVVMWLAVVGAGSAWASGSGGLVGGALLGFAGIAFLHSLYPVEPRESVGRHCDSSEALRFRVDGNGPLAMPWILVSGSTIIVALWAAATRALPVDAVAAVVAVLGAGLWGVLARIGPSVEVAIGVHHLSLRRGWVRLGRPRVLPWNEVGCAVLSDPDPAADAELLVAGAEGPLIRTGLCAPPEILDPVIAEIEAQLDRAQRAQRGPAAIDRAALDRLVATAASETARWRPRSERIVG